MCIKVFSVCCITIPAQSSLLRFYLIPPWNAWRRELAYSLLLTCDCSSYS